MGDMFKAVYDTDNDGIVDNSEALQGHPASDFETPTGAQGKVDAHSGLATGIHGVGASTVESIAGSAAKVSTHDGLASPHASATSLEKTANKAAASGYAPLDAASKVPTVNLGGAGASSLNYLRGDQTWVTPAGGAEVEQIVRTTGDITNSTTTFADVTGLTFTVAPNTDYIFEAWLIFQSNTTTTGIKFGVNGPTSPTAVVIQTHIPISLVSVTQGGARAYDSGTASASVDTINSNLLAHVTGIIRNGANSGTLAIRFAAETTGIVKIMTGSVLRYRQTL
jgi:hypothetical protein